MEALSARFDFVNSPLVPAVQLKFSRFDGNDGGKRTILSSYNDYAVVHQYGPELDKRIRRHLKQTNDSWRVDETYIKVKGQWMYLYRTVDSEGNTIDFYLSKSRNHTAAKQFLKKALWSFHVSKPRTITVDKNPAYPIAITKLKKEKKMPLGIQIRKIKYLNNIVGHDHCFIKKRIRTMLGLKSFRTATLILAGVETMHMIKKEQIDLRDQSVQNQK